MTKTKDEKHSLKKYNFPEPVRKGIRYLEQTELFGNHIFSKDVLHPKVTEALRIVNEETVRETAREILEWLSDTHAKQYEFEEFKKRFLEREQ